MYYKQSMAVAQVRELITVVIRAVLPPVICHRILIVLPITLTKKTPHMFQAIAVLGLLALGQVILIMITKR